MDECIDRYGSLVWSLARRHLRHHTDAEDAVQEIFVEIWRNAARFDPAIASEATFVTMISRRRLIDQQRRQARTLVTQSIIEEPVAEGQADRDRLGLGEKVARTREFMGRLRTQERRVLELALLEGLTQSQIAAAVDIPLGSVKILVGGRGLTGVSELAAEFGADGYASDPIKAVALGNALVGLTSDPPDGGVGPS